MAHVEEYGTIVLSMVCEFKSFKKVRIFTCLPIRSLLKHYVMLSSEVYQQVMNFQLE